jgi:hypothetical protein
MKKSKPSTRKTPKRKKPFHIGSGSTLSRKKPARSTISMDGDDKQL